MPLTQPVNLDFLGTAADDDTGYGPLQIPFNKYLVSSPAAYNPELYAQAGVDTSGSVFYKAIELIEDGDAMIAIDATGTQELVRLEFGTRWDVTTITDSGDSFDIENNGPRLRSVSSIHVSEDEKTIVFLGKDDASSTTFIRKAILGTAGSPSTLQYDGDEIALENDFFEWSYSGMAMNPAGTILLASAFNPDKVAEFSLSTAYDLSTASLIADRQYQNLSGPLSFRFRPDGQEYLLLANANPDALYRIACKDFLPLLNENEKIEESKEFLDLSSIGILGNNFNDISFSKNGNHFILVNERDFYSFSFESVRSAAQRQANQNLRTTDPVQFNTVNPTGYTVASLPTGSAGDITYATDGRKNGETAGNGTGVLVFFDGTNWIAVDSGQTVSA